MKDDPAEHLGGKGSQKRPHNNILEASDIEEFKRIKERR